MASSRFLMQGRMQYQTADELARAEDWLTRWVAAHSGEIRNHPDNGHTATVLNPPHPEGCVGQLDVLYHFQADNPGDGDVLFAEVNPAIYGGVVAQADCDSTFGMSPE